MARARSSAASEVDVAVISRGTQIRGRVQGTSSLRVSGSVDGEVTLEGSLAVEPGGAVRGDVAANDVIVDGELIGDVTARGGIDIRPGAVVRGNMGGASVTLDEGATFSGNIEADFELPPELTGARR